MPAFVSDFRHVVFAYRTSVDPAIVAMVQPDAVFVEMPGRFVHNPSLATEGGVLASVLMAAPDRTAASIIHPAGAATGNPGIDLLVRCVEELLTAQAEIDPDAPPLSALPREVRRRIAATARILGRIQGSDLPDKVKFARRRAARDMVAGSFASQGPMTQLDRMIDDGTITAEDAAACSDADYGIHVRARLGGAPPLPLGPLKSMLERTRRLAAALGWSGR